VSDAKQDTDESFLPYHTYFDSRTDIPVRERALSVRVYTCGSYALEPAYVFIHGAGFSGLSFGPLCKRLRGDAFCVALDLRCHGGTEEMEGTEDVLARDREAAAQSDAESAAQPPGPQSPPQSLSEGDSSSHLSVHTLVADLIASLPVILESFHPGAQEHRVVLFGHSLGGALACHLADALEKANSLSPAGSADKDALPLARPIVHVDGLCLIDVTEKTATGALPHMASVLARRPASFSSRSAFLDWVVQSRTLCNREIARFSAQGMLGPGPEVRLNSTLVASRPHWAGWFRGMNREFLETFKGSKLLLIGSMEKLDAEHEVAHMQGKLCVEVVPGANHNLHEDNPDQTAFLISRYFRRMYLTHQLLDKEFNWRSRWPEEMEREMPEIITSGRPWRGWKEMGE